MSKSLGNLVFVSDLLKTADPRAIRLALMRHHYRAGFEWYDTDLDEGTALLHRLLAAAERPDGADPRPFAARVRAAIDDDLDAPTALEALDDLASAILSGGERHRPRPRCCASSARCSAIDLDRPLDAPSNRRTRAPASLAGTVGAPWPTITITLPDGSTREHEPGGTAAEVAASIGRGLGQGRARGPRSTASGVDLDRPIDHDAARRDRHARLRRRARGAAPLDRARDGAGRHRPVPRRQVRDRPRDRRRLLLRLRAARRPALHRRRPRAHRGRACARS